MNQQFVDAFNRNEESTRKELRESDHLGYRSLFRIVIEAISTGDYSEPDPERITFIDHGDYQGTILAVVAASGYQPSQFWSARLHYGSCTYCDALMSAQHDADGPQEREDALYRMALNIVQNLEEV